MSLIESAFLKSRQKLDDFDEAEPNLYLERANVSERVTGEVANKNEFGVNDSRKHINNMRQSDGFSRNDFARLGIVHPNMKDTSLLHKYRNLRTKLFASTNRNFATLVTSVVSYPEAGAVASNLAAVIAMDEGKTSLLIDANVESPSLAKQFGCDYSNGLVDYLGSNDLTCSEILCESKIPRVRIIPTGNVNVNAAEYLASSKMNSLFGELKNRYPERYPIVASASINHSAETRTLMDLCDRVILVVPYGKCLMDEIRYAVSAIGKEKLLGVVLDEF